MGRPTRQDKLVVPDYSEGLELRIDSDDPRFNSALARGLAILRCFQIDQPFMSNAEIADRTGIPKATTSRLTFTLSKLGYLRYEDNVGKYEVAAGVVGLAFSYMGKQVVPSAARPFMRKLASELNANVGLGVCEGLSVLYLEHAAGDPKSYWRQRVGFRVPLVRSGLGKACFAVMSPKQHKDVLELMQLYYPKDWRTHWKELEKAQEDYQRLGYCVTVGTLQRLITTVAVPFVWGDSGHIMAFNSPGPSHLYTPKYTEHVGKSLIALSEEVRKELRQGDPGPSLYEAN